MSSRSEVFDRWELKYVVSIKMMHNLIKELKRYSFEDENSKNGSYTIKSIYYDTDDFLFYNEKIDGTKYRQKLRLRSYGHADINSKVFFEIKQRYNQTVQKRRVGMSLKQSNNLLRDHDSFDKSVFRHHEKKVIDEIEYLKCMYVLSPKVVVSYERKAFMSDIEEGLRVTFDTNLKCNKNALDLTSTEKGVYFIPPNYSVLEIKTNERIPIWLVAMIQNNNLESFRVSKYCLSIDRLYKEIERD